MMNIWAAGACAATLGSMAALLAWVWPVLAAKWRGAGAVARAGLVGLWLAGSVGLVLFPHEDVFAGLDVAAYRKLAHVLAEGRGLHDQDAVLAQVPKRIRPSFYYRTGGRPTRDLVFQLSSRNRVATRPFFMPTLPLAASGLSPLLSPDRFMPLMGSLWLALVLAAGFCAGGGWGLAAAAALVLGTAWPAWFLRGHYADGAGAALVAGVVAAVAARPLRGWISVVAGFALGMGVSFHPTLVVLAAPVGLALMLEGRNQKSVAALVVGGLAGIFPFWALTRWVCHPYGDWTRWASLREMVFSVPEHRAVFLALAVLSVVSVAALWAGFRPSVRAWFRRVDARATPWGWWVVFGLPLLALAVLPGNIGTALRTGAGSVWSGLGWPVAWLLLAGAGSVLMKRRPVRERVWLAAICAASLFFLYIQGLETPVGLWSQRRFLPVMLTAIAWLAAPLSAGVAAGITRQGRTGWILVPLLAATGLWNLFHWPAAYGSVNEQGATEWTQAISDQIGTNRWVVFDYYPHGVPYAAGLKQKVLGLGEHSQERWPEVADWLGDLAKEEEVWVATLWTPCTLEDGVRLEEVFSATGRFPVVKTKAFFPVERGERIVQNRFLRWVPLQDGERVAQEKWLDGSPLGLRGPWGESRQGAVWTRQGSGIIGPVPPAGGRVAFQAECEWAPPDGEWRQQVLRVVPPWRGPPLRLDVQAGPGTVTGILERPAADEHRPSTGVYSFTVDRPHDPAAYGMKGYSPDLGVLMRRIIIRIESPPASVPN
jgi:hypothetical protein